MSGTIEPADLAAFLLDVSESTTRQQLTVAEQTKNGFAFWCDTAKSFDCIRSPYVDQPSSATTTFLEVPRPGPEPAQPQPDHRGEVDPVAKRRREMWVHHKQLYDDLFAARTPADSMELVVAVGLLVGATDPETGESREVRRHLAAAAAEVQLDRSTGVLCVELIDAPAQEINWTPGDFRGRLVEDEGLRELIEAQTFSEVEDAVRTIASSFGTSGSLLAQPLDGVARGRVGFGTFPAVLLRRRDTSALLQLLRDMAEDMASGGIVSEPFKMVVDPKFKPSERPVLNGQAALPLPANNEQRAMIDRARREAHMVIQGPPGTGKTHTIANLAAVLMAEGRRVLVTAENERALTEVQAKLPESMRPLMLPMLRERGTGALQASVNELTRRAGSSTSREDRNRDTEERMAKVTEIEQQIGEAERRLIEIAEADRTARVFGGITMAVAGHQQLLRGESPRLRLVDRFLDVSATASPEDALAILRLTPLVGPSHDLMRTFDFPEELTSPGDLSIRLQNHRRQMAMVGDPGHYDYSALSERVDELERLASMLRDVPPTSWSEITRRAEDYEVAADECAAAASDIDHSVIVTLKAGRQSVFTVLDAYLALDPDRFDRPIEDLVVEHDLARRHLGSASVVGDFKDYCRADQLTRSAEAALDLVDRDLSGLLAVHVADHRSRHRSSIDALVTEARDLLPESRAPLGLPVEVSDGAPVIHELLRQAEGLQAHFSSGGKLSKILGTPKAVKDAAALLATVTVGRSTIDTLEEVERAVEFFRHRKRIALIDSWSAEHDLTRPAGVRHHDWLTAIVELLSASERVLASLELVDELISFPFGTAPDEPSEILHAALAAVSKEAVSALATLAEANSAKEGDLRIAGLGVRSRADATMARAALLAAELRELRHAWLPRSWGERCNPVDVDGDPLVGTLRVCSAAAAVPGKARSADLAPSALNRIAERAQSDARRNALLAEYEDVIGGLRTKLAGCVPMSPATRRLDDAVVAEKPDAYRLAMEELDREREMAREALELEGARSRVSAAHPSLIAAFDTGDAIAAEVLGSLSDLQQLLDHRSTVAGWKSEIGSTGAVHRELADLHRQLRRTEQDVAGLRCWGRAIDRLQGKRELRSALSALTTAMDKVPKTRTAKSYPARMRALRQATRDAAPAIPCWVMSIDRVAEVLGYPKDDDRFDVVIVDEASQAWFPATFLYAIADQVIVVGDDLQTSPSQVVNEAEIRSIANEHIPGHRLANQAGGDLSLYDVAAVMTGPDTMVDHFRCVPEIIDLSNRLSYGPKGKRLLPSRVREPGSLEPVKHIHVPGSRDGRTTANEIEADAIVSQVIRCHADPAYADMDFGIVVVGTSPNAHCKALVTRLLEELGPSAMVQRNLEVGTPSQFQGAERNVMFLSLLDAVPKGDRLRRWPHEHTGQNRRRVQQLNVAVSRARDQLWIFRSFGLEALAPDDARAVILEANPAKQPSLEEQLDACDSRFERDVVKALAAADPTLVIRTQVEAIGYLIDIVIEATNGTRLAVECDGDRWHTTEDRIRADLYRQRTLESIGWRFERFLASEWYDDPEAWTRSILTALAGQATDHARYQAPHYQGTSPETRPDRRPALAVAGQGPLPLSGGV